MECVHCHKPVEEGAPICRHCGRVLPAAESAFIQRGAPVSGGKPASVALAMKLLIVTWVAYILSCPINPEFDDATPLRIAVYVVIDSLILFLLIWKIHEGRNWARITYLVLLALTLPMSVMDWPRYFEINLFYGIIDLGTTLIEIYAVALLFGRASGAWFGRETRTGRQPS